MSGRCAEASDEFHHTVVLPGTGMRVEQYVYEIGSYHYNWHRDIEILVMVRGEVEVCAGGAVSLHQPGDVVVINSNEGHATMPAGPVGIVLLLHVDPGLLQGADPAGRIPRLACRSSELTRDAPPFARIRRLKAQMMVACQDGSLAGVLGYQRDVWDILTTLSRYFTAPDAFIPGEATGRTRTAGLVTSYIDRHFRHRITLGDLAREAGYSPTYLSELFATQVGMTTSEYLTRVRLAHAVRQLSESTQTIAEVASDSGFADVRSLGLAFRRAFGKPPSRYRSRLHELGPRILSTDAAFHKSFVRRDDQQVSAVLRDMAEGAERDQRADHLRTERALELSELSATAAYLARHLHTLSAAE